MKTNKVLVNNIIEGLLHMDTELIKMANVKYLQCLLDQMDAVNAEGEIDHNVRLRAMKEFRQFMLTLYPTLVDVNKEEISKEIHEKLMAAMADSKKIKELHEK